MKIRLLIVLLLSFHTSMAWAVACDAIFTNGVQSHSPGGSITFGGNAVVTGGGQTLSTANLNMENWGPATCGGAVCNHTGSPAASSTPPFTTGGANNGAINVPANQTQSRAAGNYNTVTVGQDATLNFSSTNATYLLRATTTNFRSRLQLRPGDYWVNGNLTLGQQTILERVGAAGTVRIFVSGNVTMGFRVATQNFSPGQLLIYATGSITTQNEANLSAQIYAGGNVSFGFSSLVNGSISGANVDIAQNMTVNWDAAAVTTGDFTPFCDPAVPAVLVSHWTMDEFLWDGTPGEVLDSSGNNNHATASGALTNGENPAIAGNPGTCRYGEFDGVDDYLTAPGLSSTLNATASLAFWINTTQTGSNTAWQAPGVTGVEQLGGADDIFWGWLDATGRIGVAVGNNSNTKSNSSINNGAWRHVVLTRDHQAGTYQVYIDGALDASGSIATGVIGTPYSSIGRVDNTGATAPVYLDALLDEVHVFEGILTSAEISALMMQTRPCPTELCPNPDQDPAGGLLGNYYNGTSLSGGIVGSRVDGPINFNWGSGTPGVAGIGDNQFSIEWNGFIRATETGVYRFQTASDDGVRLWVDEQLVIQRWNDHGVTTDTSAPVNLEAGQIYPIRLHFYENGGLAEIRLRWQTPNSGSYVPIPAGATPALGSGLYHCSSTGVDHYTISHSGQGVTCEAEPILITARDSSGAAIAPAAGTQVVLSTTPNTGVWVGGNVYTFTGSESQFVRYLQQTTPATLNIDVTDGTASEIASADPNITFANTGLRFYGNNLLEPIPNQVAGVEDTNPVLRIVRTDTETGACVARVQNRSLPVNLAFECRNPTSCVGGQTLSLNGAAVTPNNNNAAINYTPVNLNFDNAGLASIPMVYTDVGQVRLHGQINLPAEGNDPAVSITGSSNEFVVKPYTLVVSGVEDANGNPNPQTTSADSGFVSAGTPFVVRIEGRNALGNLTPNYGNENNSQVPKLEFGSLVYPSGGVGSIEQLGGENSFSAQDGIAESESVTWDEVGSITLVPRLTDENDPEADGNYLGAGDQVVFSPSEVIGRFYPEDYTMNSSTVTNSCGSFTYMSEPDIDINYVLQARNVSGAVVQNYDQPLGYSGTATISYVAENDNDGNPLTGRLVVTDATEWQAGLLSGAVPDAQLLRDATPEAPLENVQLGLVLTDPLDNRPLINLNMDPDTDTNCIASNNCTARTLATPLELRYGRLNLASANGPEALDLPVPFTTEYYNGARWLRNDLDNCTAIARSDINYPEGSIDDSANLSVGVGTSEGNYGSAMDAAEITFTSGQVNHFFSASGVPGSFVVTIDLEDYPWLQFDWGAAYPSDIGPGVVWGEYHFDSYHGHDRIIYWREVFD